MTKLLEPNSHLSLGERIKSIRISKGETMEEFALSVGLTSSGKSAVSRWERGLSAPSADTMKKIANHGGISVQFLVTGKPAFEDLPEDQQMGLRKQRDEWLHNLEVNSENLWTELFSDDYVKKLTWQEKTFLENSMRFVQLMKPERQNVAIMKFSSIVAGIIRARTHDYSADQIEEMKTDFAKELSDIIDISQKSPTQKIQDYE